jgi:hypothetical protein
MPVFVRKEPGPIWMPRLNFTPILAGKNIAFPSQGLKVIN